MKKIAVSIHDVTPRYDRELGEIYSALDAVGVTVRSELVVPDFQRHFNITEFPDFINQMQSHRNQGCDISLHGIYHDYAEFFRFGYTQANSALTRGLDIFQTALGFSPAGFVAPQWLQSRGSMKAVWEHNFAYTATLTALHCNNKKINAFPLNYDWGIVWVDRIFSWRNDRFCRSKQDGLIRFSMHPMDVTNNMLDDEMRQLTYLLEHGYTPTSYAQIQLEAANE